MQVQVRTMGTWRSLLGFHNYPVTLPGGSTITSLFQQLSVEFPLFKDLVLQPNHKLGETFRVLVNGRSIRYLESFNTILNDGDEVAIFPMIPTR